MKKEDVCKKTIPAIKNTEIPSVETLILTLFSEKGENARYKTQTDIVKALNEHFPHYIKQRAAEKGEENVSLCEQPAVSKALKKITGQIHELKHGPFQIKSIDGEYRYVTIGDIDRQAEEIAKNQSFIKLCEKNPFETNFVLKISERMYAYQIKKELKKETAELLMDMYQNYIFDIFYHSNKMYIVTNNRIKSKIETELMELPAKVSSYIRNKKWINKKHSDSKSDS